MTAKDVFGVIIRTFGLLAFITGLAYIWSSLYVTITPHSPNQPQPGIYLIPAVPFILIGLYFLRGAAALMKFSYPDSAPEQTNISDKA